MPATEHSNELTTTGAPADAELTGEQARLDEQRRAERKAHRAKLVAERARLFEKIKKLEEKVAGIDREILKLYRPSRPLADEGMPAWVAMFND